MMQQLRLPMVVLALTGLGAGAVATFRLTGPEWRIVTCRPGATAFARLELLFGMGKADGNEVSDAEWRAFLETEVSPRFPEGLMVLTGLGLWRSSEGSQAREKSRMVEIWYRPARNSDANIEAIRAAYKTRFGQESVMRVDGVSCVSF
jgi:uncharacterized protein DUF3574